MTESGLLPGSMHSPLRHWDGRWRLLCVLVLAFTLSMVSQIALLPGVIALTLGIVLWSRIPLRAIARRLRTPSLLILTIVILLPFAAEGEVLWSLYGITVTQEGLAGALLILVRFLAIVSLAIVFFGVAPLLEHIRAARALGVPDLITDLALLVVRYLQVLHADLQQMRTAMRLRGDPGRSWRSLANLTWLIGSLLLRSHERATRVYQAMRLRGYGQEIQRLSPTMHTTSSHPIPRYPRIVLRHWAISLWILTGSISIIVLEFTLPLVQP